MVVHVDLTEEQKQLVKQLEHDVAPLIEHHDHLQAFCNSGGKHTYVRYLRARGWNLQRASKMLRATLAWRLETKPHLIKWDEVASEGTTGKQYVHHAADKAGRPIVMMRPRNQNTKDTESQIRHLIYTLEVASHHADRAGVGKFTWLLDFGGYTMSNAPPLRVSLHCNSVLANHYPERLGLAVCYHAPSLFTITWRAVQPFIDPVTKHKIVFVSKGAHEHTEMEQRFDMAHIERCMGGTYPSEHVYDHDKYGVRMHEYDKEMAAELEHIRLQMAAAAAAADHHAAAESGPHNMAEGAEPVSLAVAAS